MNLIISKILFISKHFVPKPLLDTVFCTFEAISVEKLNQPTVQSCADPFVEQLLS